MATLAEAPSSSRQGVRRQSFGLVSEQYVSLVRRLKINGGWSAAVPRALGVTSCTRREGVSTVAANIAIAAAKDATGPILLVDANLQNPSVARNFRVKSDVGFRQVLLGDISPSECVRHAGLDHLSLMLSGPILDGRQPIYSSSFTAKLLSSLKKEFHLIVFDLPPASEITSFHFLTGQVDGVLLVIEAERIRRYAARQVAQQLARSEANMLGVVFNKQRHQTTA